MKKIIHRQFLVIFYLYIPNLDKKPELLAHISTIPDPTRLCLQKWLKLQEAWEKKKVSLISHRAS